MGSGREKEEMLFVLQKKKKLSTHNIINLILRTVDRMSRGRRVAVCYEIKPSCEVSF